MSMIGTYASKNLSPSIGNKTSNAHQPNLFQKLDLVNAEVAEVVLKLKELSQECMVFAYLYRG